MKTGIHFILPVLYVIPTKARIQFVIPILYVISTLFVIPAKTGIQFIYLLFPAILLSFPRKRESIISISNTYYLVIPILYVISTLFVIPAKAGIQFLYFVIHMKAGIQYLLCHSHVIILSFPCKRESSSSFLFSMSFPSSRKRGEQESILFICHSRVNGNPDHIFIITCNSFVIHIKTGIQYFHQ